MKPICKFCQKIIETDDLKRVFCNRSCSAKFNNLNRPPVSPEQKEKARQGLLKYYKEHPEKIKRGKEMSDAVGNYTKGKYRTKNNPFTSLLELPHRTITKIIERMGIGCSICGWNEAIGDLHHINGRKIENADAHVNICYLCPNCHRSFHKGNIKKESLVNLVDYIGDRWKEHYYG